MKKRYYIPLIGYFLMPYSERAWRTKLDKISEDEYFGLWEVYHILISIILLAVATYLLTIYNYLS